MSLTFTNEIRPLKDEEVQPAILRLLETREFAMVIRYIFPDIDKEKLTKQLKSIKTTDQFHREITAAAAKFIIERSTDGYTVSGIKNLEKSKRYLFICNHRDIVLDSGLLNFSLNENGIETTQLVIGDNLIVNQMLADLFALTKSFTVKRNVPISKLLDYTLELSSYIRNTIMSEKSSIWLAQRQGRAKDGNDQTQGGVLKMLSISDENYNFLENFSALNMVPVSISYEYDPTDSMKIPQLLAESEGRTYNKRPNEDVKAMIAGISGFKGRVHLAIGKVIMPKDLEPISKLKKKNERLKELANLIDKQIIDSYKLWSTNYMAYDLLFKTNRFNEKYSNFEMNIFNRLMQAKISPLTGKTKKLQHLYLLQYANPIINKIDLSYPV